MAGSPTATAGRAWLQHPRRGLAQHGWARLARLIPAAGHGGADLGAVGHVRVVAGSLTTEAEAQPCRAAQQCSRKLWRVPSGKGMSTGGRRSRPSSAGPPPWPLPRRRLRWCSRNGVWLVCLNARSAAAESPAGTRPGIGREAGEAASALRPHERAADSGSDAARTALSPSS